VYDVWKIVESSRLNLLKIGMAAAVTSEQIIFPNTSLIYIENVMIATKEVSRGKMDDSNNSLARR